MMDAQEMATILEDAADLYESQKVGWCQGEWAKKKEGRLSVCAEGAIYMAAGVHSDWLLRNVPNTSVEQAERAERVIAALSVELRLRTGQGLHLWNDGFSPEKVGKQEVIDLMKGKAKELRNAAQASPLI